MGGDQSTLQGNNPEEIAAAQLQEAERTAANLETLHLHRKPYYASLANEDVKRELIEHDQNYEARWERRGL